MLTKIEALGYRSLRYVSQQVDSFDTLVGPNGSGKSTFLDVVGFLGDLLRVGAYRAIVGDGQGVPQRATDLSQLTWMRRQSRFELAVELAVPESRLGKSPAAKVGRARYEVAVEARPNSQEVAIAAEALWLVPDHVDPPAPPSLFPESADGPPTLLHESTRKGWKKVVSKVAESGNDNFNAEAGGWNNTFRLGPNKSALANLPEDEEKFPIATWVKRFLMEGVRRIVLNAEAIRRPSAPGSPSRFQSDGSNLPWVVHALSATPDRFGRWIGHLRTALPDLKTVETIVRPEDNQRYIVVEYENGLRAPSWVVSDGTLRMLALTLLAYDPAADGIYLIEEPENGIHPKAVETVYQSLTSVYAGQVMCASHSPVVLEFARPDGLLCFAKASDGSTSIVRGDLHPRLRDWQGSIDLGTLFAAGGLG